MWEKITQIKSTPSKQRYIFKVKEKTNFFYKISRKKLPEDFTISKYKKYHLWTGGALKVGATVEEDPYYWYDQNFKINEPFFTISPIVFLRSVFYEKVKSIDFCKLIIEKMNYHNPVDIETGFWFFGGGLTFKESVDSLKKLILNLYIDDNIEPNEKFNELIFFGMVYRLFSRRSEPIDQIIIIVNLNNLDKTNELMAQYWNNFYKELEKSRSNLKLTYFGVKYINSEQYETKLIPGREKL